LAIAYNETGTNWAVVSFSQLEYFRAVVSSAAMISYFEEGRGFLPTVMARAKRTDALHRMWTGDLLPPHCICAIPEQTSQRYHIVTQKSAGVASVAAPENTRIANDES
jgi:hypothetical protein